MNITLDIETVPVQSPSLIDFITTELQGELADALASVKAPGNYKDAAKIAEYIEQTRTKLQDEHAAKVEKAIRDTSFDGGMGQICCIGFACNEHQPLVYAVDDLSPESEAKLLGAFFTTLDSWRKPGDPMCFIGHNLIGFDLRFIWQRAIVLGVKPPYFFPRDPKPWSETVFDTMLSWGGAKPGGSMEKLCRALGIPGKGGISGADVWPMVKAGRLAEVATYCQGDVERTRTMFHRMTFAA